MNQRRLTFEELIIVRLMQRWLVDTYQGKARRVKGCLCAGSECVGHVWDAHSQRFWPEPKV